MKSVLFTLMLCFALNGISQYDVEDVKNDTVAEPAINWFTLKQRIYVGGELGLSFGGGATFINIAPLIGYDITERFSAGLSATYQLWRVNSFNFNTFGGGVFTRLRPIEPIIMQLEYDLFNTCLLYTSPSPRDRTRFRLPSSA